MPSRPNRGKDFEKEIKTCFELVPHVSVDRLPDPMSGYSGVRNICDFSVFQSPDTFYIECKCHYGNTLNYKSDISLKISVPENAKHIGGLTIFGKDFGNYNQGIHVRFIYN